MTKQEKSFKITSGTKTWTKTEPVKEKCNENNFFHESYGQVKRKIVAYTAVYCCWIIYIVWKKEYFFAFCAGEVKENNNNDFELKGKCFLKLFNFFELNIKVLCVLSGSTAFLLVVVRRWFEFNCKFFMSMFKKRKSL